MEFLTIFNLTLILNSFLVIKCQNIINPQIKHLILQLSKIKWFSNKEKNQTGLIFSQPWVKKSQKPWAYNKLAHVLTYYWPMSKNKTLGYAPRDFFFRVCYALGTRIKMFSRLKQTVINDVFNKRFKRFSYFKRKNRGRL